jgi:hypothetical protein
MAELPSTEKVTDTYRKVTIYYRNLVKAAANFEKDKSVSALTAVSSTVRFLMELKVHRGLLAPLVEAGQIIEREMEVRTAKGQQNERDMWDSAVVTLLNNDGMSINDALKAIVGRDSAALERLKTFRERLTRKTGPKELREQYFELMKVFKGRFPTDTGKRALKASHAMRGKKL